MSADNKMVVRQVLVVGLGLIGGSFAKAVKDAGLCQRVVGCTRSDKTLKKALDQNIIDSGSNDLVAMAAQLNEGDVILLATPTLTVLECLKELKDALLRGVIVTDVASVKGHVVKQARVIFGGKMPAHFVPGHPIAGSEKSGIDAVNACLFVCHQVILTPMSETNKNAIKKVFGLWTGIGAEVTEMSVEDHDRILAATSHLPHVLAFALVDALAKKNDQKDIFTYAAGGFRDFTRIAASDPAMWHDIVIANKEGVLSSLTEFEKSLQQLREAIDSGNSHRLLQIFTEAKTARDAFSVILAKRKKQIH